MLSAGSAGGTTPSSGLAGFVLRTPAVPICMPRVPCLAPAAGVVLAFGRGGSDRAHAKSGSDGRYRVLLAPGTYRIRVTQPLAWRVRPATATVYAGRLRHLNVYLDTGVR